MNQKGFTLLEAIVALVILASAGMALLDWINTNLLTLQHVQHAKQRNDATHNALAFMDTINPLKKLQGEETIGIYKISWDATAVKLPKEGISTAGDMSLFKVGLYDTQIEVHSEKDELLTRFTLRQVGFEQVRKFDDW
jgi:general secretion pathway protein I